VSKNIIYNNGGAGLVLAGVPPLGNLVFRVIPSMGNVPQVTLGIDIDLSKCHGRMV